MSAPYLNRKKLASADTDIDSYQVFSVKYYLLENNYRLMHAMRQCAMTQRIKNFKIIGHFFDLAFVISIYFYTLGGIKVFNKMTLKMLKSLLKCECLCHGTLPHYDNERVITIIIYLRTDLVK